MSFTPVSIRDYVRLHLKSNPGEKEADLTERLEAALANYQASVQCDCGRPIWVIGSAQAGNMCFTCITGETDTSKDYEIAEACHRD